MPMCKTRLRRPAFWAWLLLPWCFASCKTPTNAGYFQTIKRDTTLQNTVAKEFDLKIKPDDLLSIGITSASPELATLFNSAQSAGASGGTGAVTGGYLVDKNGNIQLYKLGDVKAAGLTKKELKGKLESDLAPYLKDPVVTVRLAAGHVTVLGEVGSPGTVDLPADQVSLLDVLGKSGDLTKDAKKENILIIRQTDSGKEFRHLDLSDHSVFTSPYFFLQNGDVVYVEPDPKKKETPKLQQAIAYAISGISILSLILSRIR
ncbi:polysaccharide biosynthesis/export family protein [Flavisolibacter nicotianae]|uniref:polysaccharide biosynthesis/export family protein n=1 Tax=Flavisolibacter nicotianae TaxID=2364882 RepID=UPI0013C42FC7|nr:polysaccharide biosynthesis/export family protein [Flavisolibacter nicotianae]